MKHKSLLPALTAMFFLAWTFSSSGSNGMSKETSTGKTLENTSVGFSLANANGGVLKNSGKENLLASSQDNKRTNKPDRTPKAPVRTPNSPSRNINSPTTKTEKKSNPVINKGRTPSSTPGDNKRPNNQNNSAPKPGNQQGKADNKRPNTPSNPGNVDNKRPNNPPNQGNVDNKRPNNPPKPGGHPNNPPKVNPPRPGNPGGPARPGGSPAVRPNNPPAGHHPPGPNPQARRPAGKPYRPNAARPHHNFRNPNYRPPRRTGGFWGPPPPNIYRRIFFAPVPPPPPVRINYSLPRIKIIFGLNFGSFIDTGINSLANTGYNVVGYENNVVYLQNVKELGYDWPEAMIYYTDGLMSDVQLNYWTTSHNTKRYDKVYSKLVKTYGQPVNISNVDGIITSYWWTGAESEYITLQYGPNMTDSGLYYFTTLTYSDYQ